MAEPDAPFIDRHPTSYEPPTNTLRPKEDSLLTIRLIKSFEYRTTKNVILPHVDLTTCTVGQLKELIAQEVKAKPAFKVYRTVNFDTLKLYTKAHGNKTTNLIINLDNEDWMLTNDEKTLDQEGIENETEISYFNKELYGAFKADPTQKW